ncbi:MAG: sugar-binding domain-containing protein [Phycisphaerales bacterium]
MNTKTHNLSGKWQFKQYPVSARRMRDLDEGNWLDCSVPSSIFSCLIDSNIINRKELENNPENYDHVSLTPWIFKKTFDLSEVFLKSDKIELVFTGLDTFSSIWLNGKLIARTDNMFCSWSFDVKSLLKQNENELLVKFDSAVEEGQRLMNRFGDMDPTAVVGCSLKMRPFVRKAQCQFGWDWAPALPGCGIWKDVWLEAFDKACIRDVQIATIDCDKSSADIKISVQCENFSKKPLSAEISISDPSGSIVNTTKIEIDNQNLASTVIKIKDPQLWMPRGYGNQPLYKLDVKLFCENQQVNIVSKNFGIRTAKVNQTPDEFGTSFQFEINNQSVYAKGVDWIPITLFIGSAKTEDYEKLLALAIDANVNFIRVWGGGYYETDTFYDICDRLGIMVWQDFTFACSLYPDRQWFMDMIKKEATQNIIRLRNHPSLVIWCGNNEIDWQVSMHSTKGKKFYGKNIYHSLLPDLVRELDPNRDYINSTPFGPAKDPNTPKIGTVHQWAVWAWLKPTDHYRDSVPRFVSEFGFQALPCKKTLEDLFDINGKHPAIAALEKHNYMPNGNHRLYYYLDELFPPPADIDEFIYLSQVMQARSIRKYVEHLRANSNINSGVLYWQINDCCPSISWSCLDYKNRKKALYYHTRKFYAPVTVSAHAKNNHLAPQHKTIDSISISAINDSLISQTALLVCRLMDSKLQPIDEFKRPLSITPGKVEKILLPKSFTNPPSMNNSFINIELCGDSGLLAHSSFFYVPDKYFIFEKPEIETRAEKIDELTWSLSLVSKNLVKDIHIELPFDADLSDDYFDLLDKPVNIKIKTQAPIDRIESQIKYYSVNSIITKIR